MVEPLWLTAFRGITNSTNERTMVSSALGNSGVGNSAPLYDVSPKVAAAAAMLLANLDSIVLDWAARFSVGGMNFNFFIVRQLPVLGPEVFLEEAQPRQTYAELIASRVLELTYTAWDLEPFAHDLGYNGPPFKWDEHRRFLIRCELDAAFFHLYLGSEAQWKATGSKELSAYFPTPRLAVEYIMESFPIVKRKDEQAHGRYRTKDAILEIYDRMAEVIQANAAAVAAGRQPTVRYQTALNPPPGPPTDAAGNFIPMAQWDRANWPAHIHQPRPTAVPAVAAEQVQIGQAVAYLNLLLHTWAKPVVRDALEAGLVFMLNDSIRQRVLRGTRPTQPAVAGRGHFLSGMDAVLSNMKANGAIDMQTDTGRMVVSVGRQAVTVANAPAADVAKAKEAIQAVQRLGESRTAAEYAEVFDVEYALV